MDINLLHGDCLELMKDIPDKSIDMILCDLPYGTTACKWDTIIPFNPLWEQYRRILLPGKAAVLFGSQPFTSLLVASNIKGFKYSWVWEKSKAPNFMMVKYQPLKNFEDICVFSVDGKGIAYYPQMTEGEAYAPRPGKKKSEVYGDFRDPMLRNGSNGQRYPKAIIYYKTAESEGDVLHPTQKPVALLEYLIRTYTNEGETVLDNCMGSGSTGVACVNTNRNFIGIELDDEYFEIAKQRINEERNKPEQVTLW